MSFRGLLELTLGWKVAPAAVAIATIEEALYYQLQQTAAITALVGDRIYPHQAPQNPEYPFIAYNLVSTTPSGRTYTSDLTHETRIQYDVLATTYNEARQVADALRSALNRLRPGTINGLRVDLILFTNEVPQFVGQLNLYRFSVDFTAYHAK